jgi:hypothetical protein
MKLRRTLALMVALSGLAGSTLAVATAQDTKSKPKATTPDDKKTPGKDDKKVAGKIEIYEGKKGWRWRIVGADDKTIAMPTKAHDKKEDVMKELDTLKSIIDNVKPVDVKE